MLNQDTASVLARVQRGQTVEITSRGRAIARIVPMRSTPLHDLVARGRVIAATRRGPIPEPEGDVGVDSATIVSELRDDRG
jgi:prevent-host-death family protein